MFFFLAGDFFWPIEIYRDADGFALTHNVSHIQETVSFALQKLGL